MKIIYCCIAAIVGAAASYWFGNDVFSRGPHNYITGVVMILSYLTTAFIIDFDEEDW